MALWSTTRPRRDLHWQLSHIARSLDRLLNTPDSEDLAGDWQDYKRRLAWAPETI